MQAIRHIIRSLFLVLAFAYATTLQAQEMTSSQSFYEDAEQ